MQIALAAIGLFGAIYHPVGTAWVVRHAAVKGRAIAIVGSAGSLGVAIASLIAGALNDLVSWRVAFILPGAVAVAGGLALCYAARCGAVPDANVREHTPMDDPDPGERQGARQTIIALVVAMMLTAVVWYAFSTMLPKWLGAALEDRLSPGLTSIGGLIAVILLIGVPAQFLGGALADRGWAREAYVAGFAVKLSALLLALGVGGWPVLAAAGLIVVAFDVTAPIENYLIARYAPRGRRGLAYGLRFGVTIIAGPVGVWLVSLLYREGPRGFDHLLWVLSAIVVVILVVSLLILRDRRPAAATAAIGEANALAVGRKSSEAAQT